MLKSGLLALWIFSLLGPEPPEQSAIQAFRKKDLTRASLLLSLMKERKKGRRERWSRWNDQQVRVAYLGGRIALLRNRPQEAVLLFRHAAKQPSFFPKYIRKYLVLSLLAANQPKAAIVECEKAMKEHGGRLFRRFMKKQMIYAMEKGGMWPALAEHLRKLLWYPRPYGGRRHVMWKMTMAYVKAKDSKNAVKWLRQVELDYPLTRYARKATVLLDRWAKKDKSIPRSWTANQQLHRYYRMSLNSPKNALPILKRALQANATSPKPDAGLSEYLHLLIAKSLMRSRNFDAAIPVWKHIKKRTPSVAMGRRAIKGLGRAYIETARFQEALELLHKFAEKAPETKFAEEASFRSAWLAMRLQRYSQARKHFRDYRTIYPHSSRSRDLDWYFAWTLFREGEYKKALKAFKKWGRARPSFPRMRRVRFWSARANERLGHWEKAKRLYVRIAKGAPFSYYGILSQHRIHLLEDKIRLLAQPQTCASSLTNRRKKLSLRLGGILKLGGRKRASSKPWTPILDQRMFGVTNLFGGATRASLDLPLRSKKKLRLAANAPVPKHVPFPGLPGFCRSSPKSRSCRYMRKAELFASLGLIEDAVVELYEARWLMRNGNRRLLEAVQWLISVGGFHEALRLAFYLKRSRVRRRLKLDLLQVMQLHYPRAFTKLILEKSRRFGVPFSFGWAIMREESHFLPKSTSWVGAQGLMQIMPSTGRKIARRMGLRNFRAKYLYQPNINVHMGCWYLGELLKKFEGNVMLAAASYNAGPHRVEAWLKHQRDLDADEFVEEIPFRETRNYVKKVFRSYIIYNFLYNRYLPRPPTAVAVRIGNNINF